MTAGGDFFSKWNTKYNGKHKKITTEHDDFKKNPLRRSLRDRGYYIKSIEMVYQEVMVNQKMVFHFDRSLMIVNSVMPVRHHWS